jgi:hypothetical protein
VRKSSPVLCVVLVVGCAVPLESWNPQHPMPMGRDCAPPYAHKRGPDAYDVAHGQPYHCEASPEQGDVPSHDVDALESMF